MSESTFAIKQGEKIRIIIGTSCSEVYCREYECDFPNCAILGEETFESEKEAQERYPNLEMV